MKRYANLMSDAAQFRAAARRLLWRWALAVAVVVVVAVPAIAWQRRELVHIRQQHEALEAGYEPVRRLSRMNRQLRAEAIELVREEQIALELARHRSLTSLLARLSAATAESNGQAFVKRVTIAPVVPGVAAGGSSAAVCSIEVAATLTYDIGQFVQQLRRPPVAEVKVSSDAVVAENSVNHKLYALECEL